ncbi:MAG: methionyl-tRNA formyltransferase [Candidatus Kaelpia imicola]|nr:methionyl-tRNA formyltransferase [Candidatus Kaelpia imicola]
MNIVFFGSGEFAVPALKFLLSRGDFCLKAVITQPDRKAKRGMHYQPTKVGNFIASSGFKGEVLKLSDVNSKESVLKIESLSPEVFVVASYGSIISKELLGLASIIPLNIHGSLLPKYRGAAPVNWAIVNGERETGVTLFKMNERFDAGDIVAKKRAAITEDMDTVSLEERLANDSVKLLEEALSCLNKGDIKLYPQKGESSYAPKLRREDGLIDWSTIAVGIRNKVRGLLPWPGSFSYLDFKLLKIYKAGVDFKEYPGASLAEIVRIEDDYFSIKCGIGNINIFDLQLEGKKRMVVRDFLLGHRIELGMKLGA